MVDLLETARRLSARAVNSIMTATYWEVGRRIVELEQGGEKRAEYGEVVVKQLAVDLTKRFGRGFSWRNLYQMRSFFEAYPDILQKVSAQSENRILQTVSAKSQNSTTEALTVLPSLSACFPLPWSHYVRLLSIGDDNARRFYEQEALRGGWSVRQLKRQIDSQFYQ